MKWFKKQTKQETIELQIPTHIGIIMDGNGRWAKKRGLPRQMGHVRGAQVFKNITRYCEKIGVKYLTVYAFSTENWKRPQVEVDAIMDLLREYLVNSLAEFKDDNVKVNFIGDRTALAEDIQELIAEAEAAMAHKTGLTLNIAVNYGGRDEILHSARLLAQQVKEGTLSPQEINETVFSAHLYTANQPDPDLILRPSGEFRSSNFLVWQSAYAEYVFMDILWPDFTERDLDRAIEEFSRRHRRFGGV